MTEDDVHQREIETEIEIGTRIGIGEGTEMTGTPERNVHQIHQRCPRNSEGSSLH